MPHRRVVVVLAVLLLVLTRSTAFSQDRALAVPSMNVLLQNEHVRVQYHDVEVGETTAMHSHPAYVAYVFNEYEAKAILADGKELPLHRKAGEVFYNKPQTHRIANLGKTPIHNLIVELKDVQE